METSFLEINKLLELNKLRFLRLNLQLKKFFSDIFSHQSLVDAQFQSILSRIGLDGNRDLLDSGILSSSPGAQNAAEDGSEVTVYRKGTAAGGGKSDQPSAVEKSTVEIQTEPPEPGSEPEPQIPSGSEILAEISDDVLYKTALSDFSPDLSGSSKNSTPIPPLENYSISPGNSLLNRSSWSSGFVSNWAPEEANFNQLLQNALAGSQLNSSGLLLGTSPIRAVESGTGGDVFNDTANQRELEVGKISTEFEILEPPKETLEQKSHKSFLAKIAQESGLDSQQFKCATCPRMIGLLYGEYRVCAYDGAYCCTECHQNDLKPIPARIVYSWDLRPRKVSRASRAFLDHVADDPVFDVDQLNRSLYDYAKPMGDCLRLRRQLSFVAIYLLNCKESVSEELRKRLWPKEYLFEKIHLYSANDLIAAANGSLLKSLRSVLDFAVKHVLDECRLCAQKGFICEICNDPRVIYPFQLEITQRCDHCFQVYHNACISGRPCPKCQRKEKYEKNSGLKNSDNSRWDDGLIF